jgi:hypothetical protein
MLSEDVWFAWSLQPNPRIPAAACEKLLGIGHLENLPQRHTPVCAVQVISLASE